MIGQPAENGSLAFRGPVIDCPSKPLPLRLDSKIETANGLQANQATALNLAVSYPFGGVGIWLPPRERIGGEPVSELHPIVVKKALIRGVFYGQ